MEALILVGLVAIVAVTVGVLMYRLRVGNAWRTSVPLLSAVLALVVILLLVSLLMRNWINVATFSLLGTTYGLMLRSALRARRSG